MLIKDKKNLNDCLNDCFIKKIGNIASNMKLSKIKNVASIMERRKYKNNLYLLLHQL